MGGHSYYERRRMNMHKTAQSELVGGCGAVLGYCRATGHDQGEKTRGPAQRLESNKGRVETGQNKGEERYGEGRGGG